MELEGAAEGELVAQAEPAPDDLTKINGIGPAFARRLAEAGINSYADLAGLTAEEVRERTQLKEWQGDPEDWIDQARALSAS
jgi:predicted flap endonuclease-1-like 5' DNA nuclease